MITIRYRERPGLREIRFSGHAGAGAPGKDVVCAAVSALAMTLAANMPAGAEVKQEPGMTVIRTGDERAGEAFDVILRGLREIAGSLPEFVTLQETKE